MKNIAIFASGTGSNAKKIIAHFFKNEAIRIALVLSNKKDAAVLSMAEKYGVPSEIVTSRKAFREAHEPLNILKKHNIDFIVLAGFLWMIPNEIIASFPKRIINIHPSLLPKYGGVGMYGSHVHRAVLAAGDKQSGITIHYVNQHYDEGEIIFQAACNIEGIETEQEIAAEVLKLEHRYYPQIIETMLY